ncbi:hypothetical protein PG994_013002 [Apiospora phragmitis]|uniref:Uncharacterized protein n=1 Tax=Apiospora phragmitis TaxID=2905665 RepID=A0ABR1T7E9_9PEZI
MITGHWFNYVDVLAVMPDGASSLRQVPHPFTKKTFISRQTYTREHGPSDAKEASLYAGSSVNSAGGPIRVVDHLMSVYKFHGDDGPLHYQFARRPGRVMNFHLVNIVDNISLPDPDSTVVPDGFFEQVRWFYTDAFLDEDKMICRRCHDSFTGPIVYPRYVKFEFPNVATPPCMSCGSTGYRNWHQSSSGEPNDRLLCYECYCFEQSMRYPHNDHPKLPFRSATS